MFTLDIQFKTTYADVGRHHVWRKTVPSLEMISNSRILLMPYNDLWRSARKLMHQLLTTKSAESYRPFQDVESKQLMWDYLHDPAKFHLHNARYANSGINLQSISNPSHHVCRVWEAHERR